MTRNPARRLRRGTRASDVERTMLGEAPLPRPLGELGELDPDGRGTPAVELLSPLASWAKPTAGGFAWKTV